MILREQLVKFSVQQLIAEKLPEYGYVTKSPNQTLEVRSSFPTPEERTEELKVTTLAYGFDVDDGGEMAELGSTLTRYIHTLTAWVFGASPEAGGGPEFAEQVAHSIKHILRKNDDVIPIYDYNQAENPQVDEDNVLKVQVQHQGNNSTRPWDRYVWTATIQVEDFYYIT